MLLKFVVLDYTTFGYHCKTAKPQIGAWHPKEVAEPVLLKVAIIPSMEEKDPSPAVARAAVPSNMLRVLSHHRLENPLLHRDQFLHVSGRNSLTSAPGV